MQKQCKATKHNGAQCNGRPFKGGEYCWFHDPGQADQRAEGRRLGGAARSNHRRVRKELAGSALNPAELAGVIGLTIKQVLSGAKSPGVGNAVAALARASVAIGEAADVQERLTEIERALDISTRKAG